MLLVSFDADDSAQSHVEALTRELQTGFKKLNSEINGMEMTPGSDDAEVRQQVQRQLAKALMALTMDFRKEETRFLNKVRGADEEGSTSCDSDLEFSIEPHTVGDESRRPLRDRLRRKRASLPTRRCPTGTRPPTSPAWTPASLRRRPRRWRSRQRWQRSATARSSRS